MLLLLLMVSGSAAATVCAEMLRCQMPARTILTMSHLQNASTYVNCDVFDLLCNEDEFGPGLLFMSCLTRFEHKLLFAYFIIRACDFAHYCLSLAVSDMKHKY